MVLNLIVLVRAPHLLLTPSSLSAYTSRRPPSLTAAREMAARCPVRLAQPLPVRACWAGVVRDRPEV